MTKSRKARPAAPKSGRKSDRATSGGKTAGNKKSSRKVATPSARKSSPGKSRSDAAPRTPPVKRVTVPARTARHEVLQEQVAVSRLLERVRNSSSYKSAADDDPAFLAHPQTRGVRLQLDYSKPEVVMRENRIGGGIVVFGSARTPEPRAAALRLAGAKALLAKNPGNRKLQRDMKRAERVVFYSHYYEVAREFGRLVGNETANRPGPKLTVITGGGPGIMEAANRGAFDVKALNVGFNISLPHEQMPNPYITPELCFNFHYFAIRKLHFVLRAKALVAFPGGLGTLDELFEILTLVQTRRSRPRPVVLVGKAFWQKILNLEALVDEGMIDPEDLELFVYAETAREAWNSILEWYLKRGQPLVENPEDASVTN
jgi:uncharacterized protein (TIGR00730 family)